MWRRGLLPFSCDNGVSPSVIMRWVGHYSARNEKLAPLQGRGMIDKFRVWAKGGEGGNGCCSIRRGRSDPRGKPDGGNGGRGGDVILECSELVWDFSNLQHHLNAKRGQHGFSKKQAGLHGSDKIVQVPVGTVIHLVRGDLPCFFDKRNGSVDPWEVSEDGGNEAVNRLDVPMEKRVAYVEPSASEKCRITEQAFVPQSTSFSGQGVSCSKNGLDEGAEGIETEVDEAMTREGSDEDEIRYSVVELAEPGQRLLVARGGVGGLGNAVLHKMSHGKTEDEKYDSLRSGKPGSESVLILELKSLADVGLVGMPNVGKSTLLGALSRARPAVGDYAFTTLRPTVGHMEYDDFFSVKVADIPGLIQGAHENRGLGHAFLRHIERTKVIAYVLDLAAALNGRKGAPPWLQLWDLVLELEHYQEGLSLRPSLVVANKIDEDGAEDVYDELKHRVRDVSVFPVCAVLQEGVPELKAGLRKLMDGTDTRCVDVHKIIA